MKYRQERIYHCGCKLVKTWTEDQYGMPQDEKDEWEECKMCKKAKNRAKFLKKALECLENPVRVEKECSTLLLLPGKTPQHQVFDEKVDYDDEHRLYASLEAARMLENSKLF